MELRYSKQRAEVLKILSKPNYHPTVDGIYRLVRERFPKTSLATIYRNVEQLCQADKIWKVEVPGEPARYDGNTTRHYHIICNSCGLMEDVWMLQSLEDMCDLSGLIVGFTEIDYSIKFNGLCAGCAQNEAAST